MSKYADLCAYGRKGATLGSIGALLGWDQETYMPRGGGEARAEQMALLAGMMHERKTAKEFGDLISACEGESLSDEQAACVREFRRDYDKATKLPQSLVEELARTGSKAQDVWKDARKANDFAMFQPWLEKMVDLSRQKADCYGFGEGGEVYDALLDEYEPNATAREVEAVFTPLGEKLSALVKELTENGTAPDDAPTTVHAPEDRQHALGMHVLKAIGFDLNTGRLDVTTHPFCSGFGPGDTRLTTRYDEKFFPGALYGTMHEAGHGMYEQGLPKSRTHEGPGGDAIATFGTPLADSISLGIHESQSRMWENMVGRSRAFWSWIYKEACDQFAELGKFSEDEVYRAVNIVRPSFIRVEADEGTYNLHVMLRFGIERAMISGDLSVADLPGAWNERFKQMLGLDVPDHANGCLQDVHWSFGLFGYFPTYTLGNLYAAQLWKTINGQLPGLEDDFAKGDFGRLLAWLNENVHTHGRRYGAGELCEKVTGATLSAEPLLEYLGGKLRPVYGL
ncbi:MAG: carboxypeptidase M32 [Phycisphaerales bacterium]|nr:carboxypeptidase M32 [Phycisphaerales bacterium]